MDGPRLYVQQAGDAEGVEVHPHGRPPQTTGKVHKEVLKHTTVRIPQRVVDNVICHKLSLLNHKSLS